MKKAVVAILLGASCSMSALGQSELPRPVLPDAIKWSSPASMPGVQVAWVVGAGDRAGLYLLRGKIAKGSMIPAHTHPEERNGTVLSARCILALDQNSMKPTRSRYRRAGYGSHRPGSPTPSGRKTAK